MPMAPYHGVDLAVVYATLFQDLVDVLRDVQARYTVLDGGVSEWRMVPPVLSAAQIEHYGLILLFVLYKESEGRHIHGFMAFLDGLDEGAGGDDDVGSRVYYVDFDGGVSFGKV